ncbi:MAG: ABC transporter ATP-binding protein [Peptoniphilaceae bacterium]|nr:ABC transporter ATP-binding protein/permease [Peptoniphilaceae bacterium]MDD7383024.1 ABC transporter ATP-binding protein [Peptoniphilaceae bacterium]MDY3737775.1 ABC transporter ATP-binding protein [Peptoniphilaceae bacterium]
MKKYSNKELIKRFLPYYGKHIKIFVIDLISAGMTTVLEIILPLILGFLTDSATNRTLTYKLIFNLTFIYAILKIIELSGKYFMQSIGHIMGAKIEQNMRSDVFSHIQTLSDSFFNENKVGVLMSRITTDLFDITEFSHHVPEEFSIAIIKIVISLLILIRINVPLALAIYILIPVMFFASAKKRRDFRNSQLMQRKQIGELNSRIEDSFLGIKVVKSFANENIEKEKFEKDNSKFVSIKKVMYHAMAQYNMINQFFAGVMYIVIISFGGSLIINGRISAGDLVTFVLYLNTLVATIDRLVSFTDQLEKGVTGIERFVDIMDTKTDIYDLDGSKELENVKGDITFDSVSFSYPSSNEKVLDNISFEVKTGKNIALVGSSGVGKSTITNLIPRFYDVDEGEILIDGKNIKNFTLESLRDNIGIVQQDVYLFGGTVEENIKYGKPDASDEEVIEAAKLAGAYSFIMELPDKFNTYIGERGLKLSGGQKQRISIARVFLKNPPILILDEATSSLDNKSEKIVQESLDKLANGRTTITVAHRLSTIINSDEILVLTKDGISERGSHNELLEKKGIYHDLYYSNIKEI